MKSEFIFYDVMERAKKCLNIAYDKDLAELLGFSAASFNGRKKDNSIPFDALLTLANKENIDFNWLLTGEGNMYRHTDQVKESHAGYAIKRVEDNEEDDLLSSINKLIDKRVKPLEQRIYELEHGHG